VALRVDDGDGGRVQDTAQVIVANRPPSAQAGGPYAGSEGVPIVLTGSGTDPDNDPLIYTWDLDYDGVFETPGQVVAYTWPTTEITQLCCGLTMGAAGWPRI